MLIKGMTEQEIRVLQEYRRLATEQLGEAAIKAGAWMVSPKPAAPSALLLAVAHYTGRAH